MKWAAIDGTSPADRLIALYDDGRAPNVRLSPSCGSSTGTRYFTAPPAGGRAPAYAVVAHEGGMAGNFSAVGHNGLLFIYQYDHFACASTTLSRTARSSSTPKTRRLRPGPGRNDTARGALRHRALHPTSGPDQIASVYQYDTLPDQIHVFDPTPTACSGQRLGGVWASHVNTYDITKAKFVAADIDGDRRPTCSVPTGMAMARSGPYLPRFAEPRTGLDRRDASFAPFRSPGWRRAVVAGDSTRTAKGDLALLTTLIDGSSHVGTLLSNGVACSGRATPGPARPVSTPLRELLAAQWSGARAGRT